MAYFAEIDETGLVLQVIKIDNSVAPDPAPDNSESEGKAFIASQLQLPGEWIQTSYNGSFRKRYAGIGFIYDPVADVFVEPQPYPSWILDEDHDWQPPVPMPTEGGPWVWDETTMSWVEVANDDS